MSNRLAIVSVVLFSLGRGLAASFLVRHCSPIAIETCAAASPIAFVFLYFTNNFRVDLDNDSSGRPQTY